MDALPDFAVMPPDLARLLLVGGRGPGLVMARDAALAAAGPWQSLAEALALAVWADAPLCPETAALLASRQAQRPFLPPDMVPLVEAVAAAAVRQVPETYFERLAARRDVSRMLAYLFDRLRRDPADAGMAHRLALIAPMAGDAGALAEAQAVLAALDGALAPLGLLVAGELALLGGDAAGAKALARRVLGTTPLASVRFILAEALWRQGDCDGALAAQAAGLRQRPWDTLALCRLADWASGLAERSAPLDGTVAVLVYSYQHGELLDRTMASLAATDWSLVRDTPGPRYIVLDNGSGDATASVLAAWKERLGGRLLAVRLPINIGAPAARNWLAALPEVRRVDFAAYIDDDATVPPDWLGRFGAAVAAYPDAGVWGCLVRGCDVPRYVQSADTHLLPTQRQGGFGRAFDMLRPWLATADWGTYGVCRPCASVTGCCHLFRAEILAGLGGFDIRFSPSQYDDVDHDIRLLLSGRVPVCQSHLTVLHAKSTGGAGAPGATQYGPGFANQFKLHHKHDDAAMERAAGTAFAALAADLARKECRVREAGLVAFGKGSHDG